LQMPGVVADEERPSRARRLRWLRAGHGARLRGSVANERFCRSVADGERDEVCAGAAADRGHDDDSCPQADEAGLGRTYGPL